MLILIAMSASEAWAEVGFDAQGILFYTDDVGVFSATRRLSRDGDPTQPAIDSRLTDKGSDVVFEPGAGVRTAFENRWGRTELSLRGQGFIFAENPRFNHGTMNVQALQTFTPETRLRLRYYYAPNMFLGENVVRQEELEPLADEVVTSHIWSARVEQRLTKEIDGRILVRYGIRRYNESFSERDTNFWTIGPHVEWKATDRIRLGLSYHYERGLAEGRTQPQFKDDVSYINHYVSVDMDVELMERLTLGAAFHYERNIWTSDIVGDERRGAHEDIYQGEVVLTRRLTDAWNVFVGFQRSNRKQSFEPEGVKNTNVGIGASASF